MGTPEFAAPCVHVLADHPDVDLVAVVCQPDRRHGRHKTPQPPPVKVAALERGVPEILQPKRVKRGAFPERLEALAPDLIVVTAYGRILTPRILAIPRLGCVNVHASLLPRWRGAAPIQWAVASGDAESGVCLMEMEEGLDTGAVFARVSTAIGPDETGQTLHDRLSTMGAKLLGDQLSALLDGRLEPRPQPDDGVTYARMLTREDGDRRPRSAPMFAASIPGRGRSRRSATGRSSSSRRWRSWPPRAGRGRCCPPKAGC